LLARGWDPHELDKDLSGKVFLVTGANSGLGKSTATTLARKGGKVYMLCRNQERGEEVRETHVLHTCVCVLHTPACVRACVLCACVIAP
jgi:NAD(P)-dependent dehydrogenase (short-subunit alcohol dehydrogenase family)